MVEGVSYVLSDIPACLFKDCQSAWEVRLRFASVPPAIKTEGRARILIPATTAIFAPRISDWTRLEALGKDGFSCGLRRFEPRVFEALGQLLLLVHEAFSTLPACPWSLLVGAAAAPWERITSA